MSLKQLAGVIPGYVTLHIHSDTSGWSTNAGLACHIDEYDKLTVVSAIPLAPYVMEITIKEEVLSESESGEST